MTDVRYGLRLVRIDAMDRLVGARAAGGAYELAVPLQGAPERGVFVARRTDGSAGGWLATTSFGQTEPYEEVATQLSLAVPKIPRLRSVGPLDTDELPMPIDVCVEDLPPGLGSHQWAGGPLPTEPVVTLALQVGEVLRSAHGAGVALGGLRPEGIYVQGGLGRPRMTGVTPRSERFWEMARRPDFGIPQAFGDVFSAPERLEGQGPSPASDVFSLAATIVYWATGGPPFPGNGAGQVAAMVTGTLAPWTADPDLRFVRAALSRDPGDRPSLEDLLAGLQAVERGAS